MPAGLYFRGQFEFERFPVSIEEQVKEKFLLPHFRAERQAMRLLTPVWLVEPCTMPGFVGSTQELVQSQSLLLAFDFPQPPAGQQDLDEPMQTSLLLHRIPVEPTDFIVLTV